MEKIFTKQNIYLVIISLCLGGAVIGFSEYRRAGLEQQIANSLASTTAIFDGKIKSVNDTITSIIDQNSLLNNTIQTEIVKSSNLADQIGQVNDTAVTLDKLSKVDTQLLQKYSKVFFLNENFIPAGLVNIPSQYVFDKNKNYQFYDKVEPFLESMLKSAISDKVDMEVISAYRSFGAQTILKSAYQVTYGAGTANQFSADQGYSEHQLGTTVDFTTSVLKDNFDTFDKTPAYTWLVSNAYKYGFILSYPKSNSYYIYEPWHWRFVGVDLATRLYREGQKFYDLDQRVINDYLGIFFD